MTGAFDFAPDDAGQAEAKRHEDALNRLRLDYQEVFGTPAGKRVLDDLMGQTAFFADAWTGADARTNYLLGKQAIGLYLLKMLGVLEFAGLSRMSKAALLEHMESLRAELEAKEQPNER